MRNVRILRLVILLAVALVPPAFAQEDQPGSKDHPMFTRMPGYFIESYRQTDFDSFEFQGKGGATVAVEGRLTEIGYRPRDGVKVPSPLQTARNYQNALTKIGGVVLFDEVAPGGGQTSMKLVRGAAEVWVQVRIGDSGNNYHVTIVEKGAMQQQVVASAETWKSDIHATGHAAVYGIHFDTNMSDVKPESKAALDEIAKLLGKDPALKLFVVGHTDGTGAVDANMKLSQARAESVVRALTGSYGIAPARLRGQGVGPFAPIASNDSEAGRAKNRRVELVKQ
jgi:outer membrane protein OmpA-like peptidoglycan-associated protein